MRNSLRKAAELEQRREVVAGTGTVRTHSIEDTHLQPEFSLPMEHSVLEEKAEDFPCVVIPVRGAN